jgi:hypothetical protein
MLQPNPLDVQGLDSVEGARHASQNGFGPDNHDWYSRKITSRRLWLWVLDACVDGDDLFDVWEASFGEEFS